MLKKYYFNQSFKKIATILLASIFIFVIPATVLRQAKAAGGTPFGGMRTGALSCTCTGNQLIYINDYKSGGALSLVYQAGGSRLYSNNNIMGTYLLGEYQSGSGECEIYVGEDCVQQNSDGMLTFAGTS